MKNSHSTPESEFRNLETGTGEAEHPKRKMESRAELLEEVDELLGPESLLRKVAAVLDEAPTLFGAHRPIPPLVKDIPTIERVRGLDTAALRDEIPSLRIMHSIAKEVFGGSLGNDLPANVERTDLLEAAADLLRDDGILTHLKPYFDEMSKLPPRYKIPSLETVRALTDDVAALRAQVRRLRILDIAAKESFGTPATLRKLVHGDLTDEQLEQPADDVPDDETISDDAMMATSVKFFEKCISLGLKL